MPATIHLEANGRTIPCPARITGAQLLAILGQPRLTLVRVQGAHCRCMAVGTDIKVHDLTQYQELHTPDRRLFARIAA